MLRLRLLVKNVGQNADLRCCLMCWLDVVWRADSGVVWWFDGIARGLHSTLRRLDALTGLRCQECCIWRWNGQMHWRVFEFVRKAAFNTETIGCIGGLTIFDRGLHLTLRRSDALADLRVCLLSGCKIASYWRCQKCCILMIECIGGFSIYLAVSTTDVVANFWLMTQAGRQAGETSEICCWLQICRLRLQDNIWLKWRRQAGRQAGRQEFVGGCKYVDWGCRATFGWSDADRQTGKYADEQARRQKFVCWLQNM